MNRIAIVTLLLGFALVAGCKKTTTSDAGTTTDSGTDSSVHDAGTADSSAVDASVVDLGANADTGVQEDAAADAAQDAAQDAAEDAASGDASVNIRACTLASDCSVVANTCCGGCGVPTSADETSVETTEAGGYHEALCTAEGNPSCPRCSIGRNTSLISLCETGECTLLDVHASDESGCTMDMDCTWTQASCCICGEPLITQSFAVNTASISALREQICPSGTPTCGCSIRAPQFESYCAGDGHCALRPLDGGV